MTTENAVSLVHHTAVSHLEPRDNYERMLFIDYSSAINTITTKVGYKIYQLGPPHIPL